MLSYFTFVVFMLISKKDFFIISIALCCCIITNAQQVSVASNLFIKSGTNVFVNGNINLLNEGADNIIGGRDDNGGSAVLNLLDGTITSTNGSFTSAKVKTKKKEFLFPIGHKNVIHEMKIEKENDDSSSLDVIYWRNTPANNQNISDELSSIIDSYYWKISGTGNAKISFSWNSFSNLSDLLGNASNLTNLKIAAYNSSTQLWELIPSTILAEDFQGNAQNGLVSGVLTTDNNISLSSYTDFTLGIATDDSIDLIVTTTFTPNGDGVNDLWVIKFIEEYPNSKISVYDKWGKLVYFKENNYTNNWDGSHINTNQLLPAAPYYYLIDINNNGTVDKQGWVYITY